MIIDNRGEAFTICRDVELPLEVPKNAKKCPGCKEGLLIKKTGKFGAFLGCNLNCGYTESFKRGIKKN